MPECRLLCTSLFEVVLVYYYYIPRLQAYQIVYFFLKNRFKTPIDLKNLIKLFLIFLTKRFFYYITGIPYAVYLIMLDVYRFFFVSNLYSIRIFLRNKCLNLYGGIYNNNSCINIYHGVVLVNFNWTKYVSDKYGANLTHKNKELLLSVFYKNDCNLSLSQEMALTAKKVIKNHTFGNFGNNKTYYSLTHKDGVVGTSVYESTNLKPGSKIMLCNFEENFKFSNTNTLNTGNTFLTKFEIQKSRMFYFENYNVPTTIILNSIENPVSFFVEKPINEFSVSGHESFLNYQEEIKTLYNLNISKTNIENFMVDKAAYQATFGGGFVDNYYTDSDKT